MIERWVGFNKERDRVLEETQKDEIRNGWREMEGERKSEVKRQIRKGEEREGKESKRKRDETIHLGTLGGIRPTLHHGCQRDAQILSSFHASIHPSFAPPAGIH